MPAERDVCPVRLAIGRAAVRGIFVIKARGRVGRVVRGGEATVRDDTAVQEGVGVRGIFGLKNRRVAIKRVRSNLGCEIR